MSTPPPYPTERFQRVLAMASDEADGLGHGFVTCQHLLYALAREGRGLASAALAELGVTAEAAHAFLEETAALHDRTSMGRIDLADEARDAVDRAVNAAAEWGHRTLDTEHLLHGIVITPTSADEILNAMGIDPNTVLNQLYSLQKRAPNVVTQDEGTHAYRFSLESAWTLSLAHDYARRLGGGRVSSLHLLLALLALEGTRAHDLLVGELGLSAEAVLGKIGAGQAAGEYAPARLPLNDDLQRILGYAIGEAWNRGHLAVRPIHLAIGLARAERCPALDVLAGLGISQADLVDALETAL
jgi:ATP-dependent Clp protease ATP-binding subunit ClpC